MDSTFAISVAPYSQNQTSTKISTSRPSNSESFVRKAVVTVISKLCFYRRLIHIKVKKKKKKSQDASVVLIQALISLPKQFWRPMWDRFTTYSLNSNMSAC